MTRNEFFLRAILSMASNKGYTEKYVHEISCDDIIEDALRLTYKVGVRDYDDNEGIFGFDDD